MWKNGFVLLLIKYSPGKMMINFSIVVGIILMSGHVGVAMHRDLLIWLQNMILLGKLDGQKN